MDSRPDLAFVQGLLLGRLFGRAAFYCLVAGLMYYAGYNPWIWCILVPVSAVWRPLREWIMIDGPPDRELEILRAVAFPSLAMPVTFTGLHAATRILSSSGPLWSLLMLTAVLFAGSLCYLRPGESSQALQTVRSRSIDLLKAVIVRVIPLAVIIGETRPVKTSLDLLWENLLYALESRHATSKANLDVYQYDPLKPGHIRLLEMPWRLPFSELRGTLKQVPIDDSGPYEAISYCCGDTSRRANLIVDGQQFTVPMSTYDALLAASCYFKRRVVWIDAVCIRQQGDNGDEKANQIRLMHEIFSKAMRVIVWLGYAQDAKAAVDMITETMHLIVTGRNYDGQLYAYFASRRHTPAWHALTRLLRNPYFSRTWVMQEVALARKVDVMYGGQFLDWKIFEQVSAVFVSQPEMGLLLSTTCNPGWRVMQAPGVDSMAYMAMLRRDLSETSIPFGQLLYYCYRLEATEKKDKVFALMNIARDNVDDSLLPAYQSDELEVFTKVARYFLEQGDFEAVLPLAGIGWDRFLDDTEQPLPSWAADWTGKSVRPVTEVPDQTPFTASGSFVARKARFMTDENFGQPVLIMKGVQVDKISKVGNVVVPQPSPNEPVSTASISATNRAFHEEACRLTRSARSPYSARQPLQEAYWRTLVMDRTPTRGRPAYPSQGVDFQGWEENLYEEDLEAVHGLLADIPNVETSVPKTPFEKVLAALGLFEKVPVWGSNMPPADFERITAQLEILSNQLARKRAMAGNLGRVHQIQAATGITTAVSGRAFCVTDNGSVGLVPPKTASGDLVFILEGTGAPFIMRKAWGKVEVGGISTPCYQLVGECYIHGIMDGEAVAEEGERAVVTASIAVV
jgi:hypothetical protein